ARTGDTARASAQLSELSSRVPGGPEQLAPAWRADLTLYRPGVAGSVGAARRRIIGDLDRYVRAGGNPVKRPVPGPLPPPSPPPVPGPAPGGTNTPPTVPSLD